MIDAHLHVIDPRFPLVPNQGYVPPCFTAEDYRRRVRGLGVVGGAVVSGSFQGHDQAFLRAALAELGPGFAGVTQLPPGVTDEQVRKLHRAGVRAVRFALRRGSDADPAGIERLARRVHELAGWHAEFYLDAAALEHLAPVLRRLPRTGVDHLGMSAAGLPLLLELVGHGVKVKATGFGRVDLDVPDALRRIHAADPSALLFGTDLPSTRAERPFRDEDVGLVVQTLGAEAAASVLHDNAAAWYGLPRASAAV
ncbi:2-pyrone-4,6-dicarboxylate hydrolase [Kocuria rosea subsp. polaris]|uniref:2-pyrone-4,6-dicarboxylate hydrolase n=1 Tax=Kocuria rosea subsp. polaris TaxID=136273 RepID=A0A0W8I4Q2_KOCRO|nr:amidohydrolase family protein [Kocuria polaris]KUG52995.1 2-pyrone-4,6-dicarboxylate hydrolase [Kocuria polaris]